MWTVIQPSTKAYAQTIQPEYWAVIAGVSHYRDGRETLGAADARDLSERLQPVWGKDHIKLLEDANATKASVRDAISSWLAPREDSNDTVLFFFSGHGGQGPELAPFDEIDGHDEYLAPYDSTQFADSAIRDDELSNWLSTLDSQKVVIIIESCYSGGFVKDLSKPGRVIITSCAENEESWAQRNVLQHSVFTYYALKGLDQLAALDANKDSQISAEDIFRYAQAAALSYVEKRGLAPQHPQIGDFYPGELALFGIATVRLSDSLGTYQVYQSTAMTVDGKRYSSAELPLSLTWPSGTTHVFAISGNLIDFPGGKRYKFVSWSDGSTSASRTITVSGPAAYEAIYRKQCYLTVNSRYGNIKGADWYDADTVATLSVSPTTIGQGDGSRYIFVGWSGDSKTTVPEASIKMDSPKTVTANWQLQYRLTVRSQYGVPEVAEWHNAGETVSLPNFPDAIDHGDGTRHKFAGWSPSSVTKMDSPKTVTANWQLQYRLTVKSEYGEAKWQEWSDANAIATFSAPAVVDHKDGSRHKFIAWGGAAIATTPEASIKMDSPRTVTASWQLQYYLALKVAPSGITSVSGEGWYDAGIPVATGAVPEVVKGDAGTRYVFLTWKVDGIEREGNPTPVVMDSPHTAAAGYETQHYLTIESEYGNPQGAGWHVSGSQAKISVTSPVGTLVKHIFVRWSEGVEIAKPSTLILVDKPKTVTVSWRTDYTLLYAGIAGVLVTVVAILSSVLIIRRRRTL